MSSSSASRDQKSVTVDFLLCQISMIRTQPVAFNPCSSANHPSNACTGVSMRAYGPGLWFDSLLSPFSPCLFRRHRRPPARPAIRVRLARECHHGNYFTAFCRLFRRRCHLTAHIINAVRPASTTIFHTLMTPSSARRGLGAAIGAHTMRFNAGR